jgi:hypothetical protein
MRKQLLGGRFFSMTVGLVACSALGGCSKKLDGPTPKLEAPMKSAKQSPVDPGLVCRDQLTTKVTVHGEGFSPIPIDIPKAPKTALPSVTLTLGHNLDGSKAGGSTEVLYSGDPNKDTTNSYDGKTPLLTWKSQTELTFTVNQSLKIGKAGKGMLPVGIYDVSVENADGHEGESPKSFAVVDKPALSKVSPTLVCLAQSKRTVTLTGQTFLRNGTDKAVLSVAGVDTPFSADLSDCTKIDQADLDAEICNTATVELAMGSIANGFPALTVDNPETAACHSTDDVKLRVVPPPSIDRVDPSLACVTEGDRKFTIKGADFLTVDGTNPKVAVGMLEIPVDTLGGCEAVDTQGATVQKCTSIDITVKKGALMPDLYAVTVTNPDPAGCDNTAMGALRIVPPPALTDVQPPLVCVDDGDRKVTAVGTDFLVVDGTVPKVEVDGMALDKAAIDPQGCSDLKVDHMSVQTCTKLELTLAKNSVATGMADIKITNPDPAGCSDERMDLLTVVKGPTIASAEPALVCTDDASKAITIKGTGFLTVGSTMPAVNVGGSAVKSVDSAAGCTAVMVHGLMVQSCTTLDVTVAKNSLMTGHPTIEVQNPDPAGCTATNATALTVPPALAITMLAPLNVCQNTTNTAFPVALTGTGFLHTSAGDTTATFDGAAITTTTLGMCTTLGVAGDSAATSCTMLSASLDLTGKTGTPGMLPIAVSNATAAPACGLTAMTALTVVAPPTVTGIDIANQAVDTEICSDNAFTLNLTGTNFVNGTKVTLKNSDNKTVVAGTVTVSSATMLSATFSEGLPYDATDPSYDLVVETADNCAGPAIVDAITVDPTPLVFFVDPPIVYNAIATDATVYTANLSASATFTKAEIVGPDPATAAVQVTFTGTGKPNRNIIHIPGIDSGTSQPTFAAGNYTVRVTSSVGCTGDLPGGLKVTATLDNSLVTKIDPSFVSPTKPTDVTVTGSGFLDVPRLYLTPSTGTGTATALRAVTLQSGTQLSAIVPGGVSAGNYDLVVVNPDGKVGLLSNGVTVTTGEPPVVTSVVPASLVANSTTTVTATGTGFDATSMTLECKATSASTTVTNITGTLGTHTATSAQASFNTGTVAAGSVCLLKLQNTDGAFFEYSAVSITNSSLNLSPWVSSDATNGPKPTPLTMGRRALSLVAGRPTTTSRFLYAIGGDSGVAGAGNEASIGTNVFDTVEAANVDVYGNMGSWGVQTRTPMPAKRTWAGAATIGRFVYLVGGHDGTSATDTLYRSQILDPLATSDVEDLDATLGDGTHGLDGGLYYYGVAAIFPSNDLSNPGGESLVGELLPVQLPSRTEKIILSITWKEVPGAHGYRIYRSPTPNAAVDSLLLLHEQTCGAAATDTCNCGTTAAQCRLQDDGSTTPSGNGPLPAGSLGAWHPVDGARCTSGDCLLATKREGLTTVAVQNPSDATKYFLYAVGGRNETGTYQTGYEIAVVTVAGNGTQTVADWSNGGTTLSSARAELGVWVMTANNSAIIRNSGSPTDVWFYLGGGRNTGGVQSVVQAGKLQTNGDIGTSLTTVTALKGGGVTGFGAGTSNDHLYAFGGSATAGSGMSADPMSPLPTLPASSWNSLGAAQISGIYSGATQESAFYFMVGGWFGGATLSTTAQTVQ